MNLPIARVAVITRTKNREIMLERAADSVCRQKYRDFIWIVVNDGGEQSGVDAITDRARSSLKDVIVIHHETNKGMEAASNAGINAAFTDFIVIHDDDDTWHPEFLLETVKFLDSDHGKRFGGVVSGTVEVTEKITDKGIQQIKTKDWNPYLGYYPKGAVQIADIASINQFPPISFLYRREIAQKVALRIDDHLCVYDSSLPVLGDWEFNLRFIRVSDIAVIDRPLANYHLRPNITAAQSSLGNSVHAGYDRHSTFEALIRNKVIREYAPDDALFAGMMFAGRTSLIERRHTLNSSRIADFIVKTAKKIRSRLQGY